MLFWVISLLAIIPWNEEYVNARFDRSNQVPNRLVEDLKKKTYELDGNTFDWYYYHSKIIENKNSAHIMAAEFGHMLLVEDSLLTQRERYNFDDWNGETFPLIIPIHFGKAGKGVGHWVTAVIDQVGDELTMHYFDFYNPNLPQRVIDNVEDFLSYKLEKVPVVKKAKGFFASFFSNEKVENPVLSEIQVFRHKYQFDGYSCGVFSLYVMELYMSKVNQLSLNGIFDKLTNFKPNDIHEKRQEFADLLQVDIYNEVVQLN